MSSPDPHEQRERPALDETLRLLQLAGEGAVTSDIVYGLNSLTTEEAGVIGASWPSLDEDVRRRVVLALSEAGEADFELDFTAIGRLVLNDPASPVRTLGIELLWEDTSLDVMSALLEMAHADESAAVRAAAASALGPFILMGELGEIDSALFERAQELLLEIYDNEREDTEVRRRALEAVANSSHEAVEDAILDAFQSEDRRLQVSALFAMGRTADDRWAAIVLDELGDEDHELRYEAARAAGELELEDAISALTQIAFDDEVELRDVAVWALGEIGGRESLRVLNQIGDEARENEDEELLSAIEDAIAMASLGGDSAFYLMDADDGN